MKRFLFLLLLLFSLTATAQTAKQLFEDKYAPEALRADLDTAWQFLRKNHPGLDWFISKKQLSHKIDSLRQTITIPLSAMEFRTKMLRVLQHIGDGHLTLTLDASKLSPQDLWQYHTSTTDPIRQFDYKIIDDRLYILSDKSDHNTAAGTEILAIDEIPSAELIHKMNDSQSADGYNHTLKYYVLNSGQFSEVYLNLYGRHQTLTFTLKAPDSIRKLNVNTKPVIHNTQKNFSFANSDIVRRQYARIAVTTFDGNHAGLYADLFRKIRKDSCHTLILDLRNNNGGTMTNVVKLFSYLISKPAYFAKIPSKVLNDKTKTPTEDLKYGVARPVEPDSLHFNGKVYVLINGGSFSATCLLAGNLQANLPNAIFVGEETGGGRDGCIGGVFRQKLLPNSKLVLNFGQVPFKVPVAGKERGRGVMPDIAVKYTLEDYLKKKDMEMERVKKEMVK